MTKQKLNSTWKCAIVGCRRKATEGKFCKEHYAEQNSPEYKDLVRARQEKEAAELELHEAKYRKNKAEAKAKNQPEDPFDHLDRVTELEAMTYRAMEAEVRTAELVARNLKHEMVVADRTMDREVMRYQKYKGEAQVKLEALVREFEATKAKYHEFVNELAKKHNIDPKRMAIDPEMRTIRDLGDDVSPAAATPPT